MTLRRTIYVHVVFLLLSASRQCIVPEEKHNQRLTPSEFVDMLSTTSFGVHFKFSVRIGEQTGVVFFQMK